MSGVNDRRCIRSMESRMSHTTENDNDVLKCHCKLRCVIRVSGSEKNPGKLYYGYPKIKVNERCGFFMWFNATVGGDNETISVNNVEAINERWMKNMSKKLNDLDCEVKRLNVIVIVGVGLMVFLVAFFYGFHFEELGWDQWGS